MTVGELKKQGQQGLHIRCSGCGYIVIAWWQSLSVPDERPVKAVIGQLKCGRCGSRPRPRDVRPYRQGQEAPAWYSNRT